MHTLLTADPKEAAAYIHRGDVVAFPTETVYGLGADVFDPSALRKIFEAKGRPSDNPLITHVADLDQIPDIAGDVSPAAQALIARLFPGPLTVVLPRHPSVPSVATGGLDTIGVRMPAHPVAQSFLQACGRPVAAPSANLSGRPSPTTWEAVRTDLGGRIPCILQGGPSTVGLESTVVDCTGDVPIVLRAGAVTLEALRAFLPETRLATDAPHLLARSPGTRYRHYAPGARVLPIDDPQDAQATSDAGYIGLDLPPDAGRFGLCVRCADVDAYARELFDFFRRCDAAGLTRIYCQTVPARGIGLALMDRLERAAHA